MALRAQVWLCDLLPPGLADDLAATQRNSVDLDSMVKHQPGGRAVLRSTFVDTDMRRAMYRAGFVEDGEGAAAGGGGDAEPAAASGGGDAGPALSRLESSTEAYTGVELRMKALKSGAAFGAICECTLGARCERSQLAQSTPPGVCSRLAGRMLDILLPCPALPAPAEQSFIAWQHSAPGVVATAAAGAWSQLVPAASDLALSSWRRVSRILSATGDEVRLSAGFGGDAGGRGSRVDGDCCREALVVGSRELPAINCTAACALHPPPVQAANGALEDAGEAGGAAAPKPPPPLPQPAGSLVVTIERLQATASAGSECFIVLKSGPHWARSKALMLSGGEPMGGWAGAGLHTRMSSALPSPPPWARVCAACLPTHCACSCPAPRPPPCRPGRSRVRLAAVPAAAGSIHAAHAGCLPANAGRQARAARPDGQQLCAGAGLGRCKCNIMWRWVAMQGSYSQAALACCGWSHAAKLSARRPL